jgi:glycosyltransferase involved in cell wall biosynthesis
MTGKAATDKRQLRIVMVVSNALTAGWGSTTHVFELAHELGRVADLRLYVRRPEGSMEAPPGAILVRGSSLPIVGFLVHQARLFLLLLFDLRRTRPDVIYSRYTPFGVAPAGISLLLGIPHVIELNGIIQEDMAAEGESWHLRMLARLSERYHYLRADGIVAVTVGIADDLALRYGRTDTIVVPNGVNCEQFRPDKADEAAERLGLASGYTYISFIGNLASWQGVDVLLDAAPRILEAVPSARFLIVGDGSERENLHRRAEQLGVSATCTFTGSVPYRNVPQYINASSVCTAPFVQKRNERTGLSPLKIYEYFACARPVVTTDVPGVRELILDSGGGVVVPPGDSGALAEAVIHLLRDGDAGRDAGARGGAYVTASHCWRHVAMEIFSSCQAVIRSRGEREEAERAW